MGGLLEGCFDSLATAAAVGAVTVVFVRSAETATVSVRLLSAMLTKEGKLRDAFVWTTAGTVLLSAGTTRLLSAIC